MPHIGPSSLYTPHRLRGLYGAALLGLLTAWTVYGSPLVFGAPPCCGVVPGVCLGNTSYTNSTTHHTVVTGVASGAPCPVQVTNTSTTTTTTFGPAVVLFGDDLSQSCFVAVGDTEINTNTDYATFIEVCAQVAPALAPWALAACAAALAAYAVRRVNRVRRRR